MMIGSYPCCDGPLMLKYPDKVPQYMCSDCPHCGEKCWHFFSNICPLSWTDSQFLETHTVDEETRIVRRVDGKSEYESNN
jgi:hypothetical protein